MHTGLDVLAENVPATHVEHIELPVPVMLVDEPAPQLAQLMLAATVEYVPAVHATQVEDAVCLMDELDVPARQAGPRVSVCGQ